MQYSGKMKRTALQSRHACQKRIGSTGEAAQSGAGAARCKTQEMRRRGCLSTDSGTLIQAGESCQAPRIAIIRVKSISPMRHETISPAVMGMKKGTPYEIQTEPAFS